MLAVVWPVSWLLFVPIVLVEAFVAVRVLSLPYGRALILAGSANAISTLVGLPLTWVLLTLLGMFVPASVDVHGTEASLGNLLAVGVSAPWLEPTEPFPSWAVPTAALVLCVPFFLTSVWMEGVVVRRLAPDPVADRAFRWSWRANLATYTVIGSGLLVLVWISAARS